MERELQHQPDFKVHLSRRTFDPKHEPDIPPSEKPEQYIVQFKKSLTKEEREHLRTKYNLALNQYIPNFAFLERLDFRTLTALSEHPLHRASALLQSNDKISPAIDTHVPNGEQDDLLIRVLLFSNVNEEEMLTAVKAIRDFVGQVEPQNGHHRQARTYTNGEGHSAIELNRNEIRVHDDRKLGGDVQLVLILPSMDLLPPIAKLDQVKWIEEVVESTPDRAITTTVVATNTISGTIQAGDPLRTPFWDNGLNGTGQRIGIIDHTNVDLKHCMFRDVPGTAVSAVHRKVVGWRQYYARSNNDHGTRVASIAAGDDLNNPGTNADRGVAWNAKISYDDKKFIGASATLLQLLQNQFNDEVLTHSNSWHDRITEYNQTARDVDSFLWENEEHLVCASAGNNSEELGPPGSAKNTLCVSASQAHPNHLEHGDGRPGPTRDYRRKPDICAPSAAIRAADAGSGCGFYTLTGAASSYATPVIAGAAALVRQYYLDGFYPGGSRDYTRTFRPSGALVKATLLNTTVPMEDVSEYPNYRTGWGLVRLDNSLFLTNSPRKLFVADVPRGEGLLTGQSQTHQVNVYSNDQPLKVTLVWTDPPAELLATGRTLINNLDLVVTSPDGDDIYLGNVNFDQGFSLPVAPDTYGDDRNNVEMVIIRTPAPGVWTITVKAVAVNFETQGYAVVVSGSLA